MKKEEVYRMTLMLNQEVRIWKNEITEEILRHFNMAGFCNPTNFVILYDHYTGIFSRQRMMIPKGYLDSNKGKIQLYYELANLDKAFPQEVLATIVVSTVLLEAQDRRDIEAVFISYQDKLRYSRNFYRIEKDGFGRKKLEKDELLSGRTYGFEDQLFRSAFTMQLTPN